MKKLLFFIPYTIVAIIFIFMLSKYVSNTIYINKYEDEKYNKDFAKYLFTLNYYEKEVAYFNYGTYAYKTKNYYKAADNFEKALKVNKKKNRDCSIRINAALSYLEAPDEDTSCDDWKYLLDKSMEVLKNDKSKCYRNGSAIVSKAVDVEEYYAEKLQEYQAKCEQSSGGGGGDDDENQNGGEGEDENQEPEQDPKEKEIEDRNNNAEENRNKDLEKYKDADDKKNGGSSSKPKKTW